MNTRLATLLAKIDTLPQESVILDCYNQAVIKDVAMTVTTRIDANNYYLLEMLPKEPSMYRVPYGKTRLGGIVPNHIAGTLSASSHEYNELVIEPIMQQNTDINPEPQMLTMHRTEEAKQLRRVNGDVGVSFRGSKEYTIKSDGVSNTLTTFTEKECLIAEPTSCAIRGRNPEGSPTTTEQRLEMGDNIANCITSVQKDSLIAEPVALGYSRDSKSDKDGKFHTRRHFSDVANTVCASSSGTHETLIAEPIYGPVIASTQKNAYVGSTDSISPCLTEAMGTGGGNVPMVTEPAIRPVGNIYPGGGKGGKVVDPDGIAPAVCECHGEVTRVIEPMVSADPLGHAFEKPRPQTDVAPTLRAIDYKCPPVAYEPVQYYYRIRKLTPKECFRLMDVDDPDIDKLIEAKDAKGKPMLSKSANYKLAGNSIVVSCLFHIFDSLFYGDNTNPDPQLTLF